MTPRELEDLLQHAAWLRRLARRLVSDPDVAEDLLQETWVRTMERPPGPGTSLRAWLSRVLKNQALQRWRSEGRRGERERRSARAERVAATDELFERFALQRELLARVDELEAGDREVILLRFFEDLPPRRIAERLSLETRTVETRLRRALERLRARLHGGREDGSSWVPALALFARRRPAALPAALGALAMSTKVALGLAAATGIAAAGLLLGPRLASGPAPVAAEPAAVAPAVELAPGSELFAEAPPPERYATEQDEPEAGPAVTPVPTIAGRVVFADGRAAPGVGVRYATGPGAERAVSDAAGVFRLPASERFAHIEADEPGLLTVVEGDTFDDPSAEPLLVVAPHAPLAGRVVDPLGNPVEGALLTLVEPRDFWARVPAVAYAAQPRDFRARSDAEGRFDFPERPLLPGATVTVRHPDHEDLDLAAPDGALEDWRIELVPLRSRTGVLEGVVLDAAGAPLADATVALGESATRSDEEGSFRFRLDEIAAPDRLLALHPSFAPLELPAPRDADGRAAWPPFVELRLVEPPLAIEGLVLDGDGTPVPNASVWADDPTVFAYDGELPLHAETRLADTSRLWNFVTTDASGAFRLPGLLERTYRLRAADPRTTRVSEAFEARAGERRAVLRFAAGGLCPRLEVRVVDREGEPLEAELQLSRETFVVYLTNGDGYAETIDSSPLARTDERGVCLLEDVPRAGSRLRVQAKGCVAADLPLELGPAPEPLRVELARRCLLRVEVGPDGPAADTVELRGADGEPLPVTWREVGRMVQDLRAPLLDGRQNLTAPDTAVRLILLLDGQEVLQVPVELDPDGTTTVRL